MRLLRNIARRFADAQQTDYRVKPKTFLELLQQNKRLTKAQVRWNNFYKSADTKAKDEPQIDLKENFLYGFETSDFVGRNPIIKRALSTVNATSGQLLRFKKDAAMRKFQLDFADTGSPVVQVACMTEQIIHNMNHCVKNNKDHLAKRKLMQLMRRRVRMLHVLKKTNPSHYVWIVRDYNIQQSQKKNDSYRALDRIYKRPVQVLKAFRYRSYSRDGYTIKDLKRAHYQIRLKRLRRE